MKRTWLLVRAVAAFLLVGVAPARAHAAPAPTTAEKRAAIPLTVPVNLVLGGYTPQQIQRDALLAQLPASSDPVIRQLQFYGLPGRDLGGHYRFVYDTTTNKAEEGRDHTKGRRSAQLPAPKEPQPQPLQVERGVGPAASGSAVRTEVGRNGPPRPSSWIPSGADIATDHSSAQNQRT